MADMINKDFEHLEKIISVIGYPSPSLTVKHVVSLIRKVPPKNNKKEEERGYAFYYTFNKGSTGLYLESRSSIILEGHRNVINNEGGTTYKKIACIIDMKDVANFLNRLDVAYGWLVGEQNKQIYLSDVQGRPCKILDPSKKVVVTLSQSTYVAFKPCIIRDMSDVTYEGIAMGNEQGEITNFTASEYSSFRIQMQGLLPNLYIANNVLINNAIQLSIYNSLKALSH
jgi:hypothetical protein